MQEIKNQTEWNELVMRSAPKSGAFLQSWEWGEFQRALGRKVFRFASNLDGTQVIEVPLLFGKNYWFVPRGNITQALQDEARKQGVMFARFEPTNKNEVSPGAVPTIHVNPPATLLIDLTKSEEALLAGMHEKTRYNVRLAIKKGVSVQRSAFSVQSFEKFWKLLSETARRDRFHIYPRSYYEMLLRLLDTTPHTPHPTPCSIELWTAEWNGKTLAAGLWSYFGNTVTYLHGASSSENRNVMAPYLLHWEVMREAKARGFAHYDMWGISVSKQQIANSKQNSWEGITRFKIGFGGEAVSYPGTFDLPISVFGYKLYQIARKIRRMA